MSDLQLLITIARREDAAEFDDFYRSNGITTVYSTPGFGTARKKTLRLFGLEESQKTVLFAFSSRAFCRTLFRKLSREMQIDLPDRGVAVALPVNGVGSLKTLEYVLEDTVMAEGTGMDKTRDTVSAETKEPMESGYELIVAVYESGYTDQVMDAARGAGAGGGTMIHAKGTGSRTEKFFGMALAQEKEMVFIVSRSDRKKDIMRAISHEAGPNTKAHALVFSLPVSETAGFRLLDEVGQVRND
jgi:nitrogen regulatory protein PII